MFSALYNLPISATIDMIFLHLCWGRGSLWKRSPLSLKIEERLATTYPSQTLLLSGIHWVWREKLGNRIFALKQLVSPFGRTDKASILLDACEHIRFLHEQVEVLLTPYTRKGTPLEPQQQAPKQDLRSQRLCLVPVSSTFPITNQTTTDFSSPIFEEKPPDEPKAYKAEELFP